MRLNLYINCDNAAFEPNPETEVARILRNTADRIESGEMFYLYRTLWDLNGNDVGRARLSERED